MDNLAPVRSFLQELIKPIVDDVVKEAIPKALKEGRKPLLSLEEVMKEYHISSSTIYRRFDSKELTKVKYGNRTLVKRWEIEKGLREGTLMSIDERGIRSKRKME